MSEKTVIAVIDTGVNRGFFSSDPVAQRVQVTPELLIREDASSDDLCELSHGTCCAAIIEKFSPQARIISIKITCGEARHTSKDQLAAALRWCLEKRIRLIHLSMGTVDCRDFGEIVKAAERLAEQGTILVAAHNNFNLYTCPASLPCVIGVKTGRPGLLIRDQILRDPDGGGNFIAGSCFELADRTGVLHHTPCSNSFAAPVVTARIDRYLRRHPRASFSKVRSALTRACVNMPKEDPLLHIPTPPAHPLLPAIAVCGAPALFLKLRARLAAEGYTVLCVSDQTGADQETVPLRFLCRDGSFTVSSDTFAMAELHYPADVFLYQLEEAQNQLAAAALPFDVILFGEHFGSDFCDRENAYFCQSDEACISRRDGRSIIGFDQIFAEIIGHFILE